MDWQRVVGKVAAQVEHRFDRGKRHLMRHVRPDRPARVVGYRSYGTSDVAYVRGRVLHGAPLPAATPEDRWWVNLAGAYRRLQSAEVPKARLRVRIHDVTTDVTADDEGHFRAAIRLPNPLPDALGGPLTDPQAERAYWHDARVELVDPQGAGTTVPVAIPTDPRFGIISDLDDTVLQTDVRNVLRMAREVLFGNAHTRIPFPGVAAFYRALHDRANPLFYVSSSPWNLYDVLSQFLHLHRIPAGSMDLRDWGLSRGEGLPTGHHGHKREAIDRILRTYPDLSFILVGDSGQEDPEIYRGVVHDHPERILAIYIRSVVPDPARVEAVRRLGQELADHGLDLVLAHDTLDAARHAAGRGWIPPDAVDAVARDRAREEDRSR